MVVQFCEYTKNHWTLYRKEEAFKWEQSNQSFLFYLCIESTHLKCISRTATLNTHWKDWCWNWSSNTLATWCIEPTHWKRPWCWERLKAGGEGNGRGWDGWMASPTQWTWVWANSGRQWRTGKPGMLQSMGLQSWTWLSDWTTTMVQNRNR